MLIAGSPAGAQVTGPVDYCGPGGVFCIAVRTALAPSATPGVSIFSLFLQNLQGPHAATFAPIDQVTLFGPLPAGRQVELIASTTPGQLGTPVGNVGMGTDLHGARDDCSAQYCTNVLLQWDFIAGIVGCTNTLPSYLYAFQTCASQGLDGWVRIDFGLSIDDGGLSQTPIPVTYADFGFSVGQCSFNGGTSDCGVVTSAPVATPEPATLALLGTGLVGIVGLARRRRT